ncbi:MAG: hypothetical protein EAZ91_11665 [Cytophagales bacterium]|nr:MAG: hypothetical protein EAZ91_11665 [Cytophagales bacterium]
MNEKHYIRLDELDTGHSLRQHPFEQTNAGVPDGYFDKLPSIIQDRVVQKQRGWSVSWSWQRSVASLAGAGLVAALVWVTWPARQESLGQESLAQVSDAAIVSYLEDQGISSADLAEYEPIQHSFDEDAIKHQLETIEPKDIRDNIDPELMAEDEANIGS